MVLMAGDRRGQTVCGAELIDRAGLAIVAGADRGVGASLPAGSES